MSYEIKYLKYKMKYLTLKKQFGSAISPNFDPVEMLGKVAETLFKKSKDIDEFQEKINDPKNKFINFITEINDRTTEELSKLKDDIQKKYPVILPMFPEKPTKEHQKNIDKVRPAYVVLDKIIEIMETQNSKFNRAFKSNQNEIFKCNYTFIPEVICNDHTKYKELIAKLKSLSATLLIIYTGD